MPVTMPIKLTFCLRKRPDWTEADFHDYWLNSHGPLVRSFEDALGTWKYSQLHRQTSEMGEALAAVRGAPQAFDGIAEMWWRSRKEMEIASLSSAGREAGRILLEDEKKFIDLSQSPVWLNEVHDLVKGE
jgi:EthD domain